MQLLDDLFGKGGDSVDQKKVLDHIPWLSRSYSNLPAIILMNMNPVPCYQRDTKLLLRQAVEDSSKNLRTSEVPQEAAYEDEKRPKCSNLEKWLMEEIKNIGRGFNNEQKVFSSSHESMCAQSIQ